MVHDPKPVVATRKSIKINVQKGNLYHWCACGRSQNQPFCDGSHKDTGFKPVAYTPEHDQLVGFCGCKYTKTAPLCDGAHKCLPENV
ncbi:MAG: CDGSH iron-sulfur domain-containing protein [Alphaproteobacteria bacterium]|nr:CDGSH iron-sulfur domain-containing protein [Alphaproteobacteria bacterium]